jgi:hypothetical protein
LALVRLRRLDEALSELLNNGSSSFIVQSPEELLAHCGPAEPFRRPNMIFQEYIPGED